MPIIIDKTIISSPYDFFSLGNNVKNSREELIKKPIQIIDSTHPALYVDQNEFAVLKPGQADGLELIGSDEATTCSILIFRHSGNGVVCLGHLDGSNIPKSISSMFQAFKKASSSGPEGLYEMHLIGGFEDSRGISDKVMHYIIEAICSLEEEVHLRTSCVLDDNDFIDNDIHYPIVTGVGVAMTTGELLRVRFAYKGPDAVLRSACNSFSRKVVQVYKDGVLSVGPCYWSVNSHYYEDLLTRSDKCLLDNMSTSPEQESETFVPALRAKLSLLAHHPNSKESVFSDGKAKLYRWSGEHKEWFKIDS